MIEETLPPNKTSDGRSTARGAPQGPPVDQSSETLDGFTPQAAPPVVAAPADETHPKRHDPTYGSSPIDGRTLLPTDAAPAFADQPTGTEPTLAAMADDATIAGHDPQTQ